MNQTDTRATRQRHTLARRGRSSGTTSTARVLRTCVLLALVGLLQACGFLQPSWVEAPLVADGSSARNNSGYTGTEPKLYVSPGRSAHLKFSYATLPRGALTLLTPNAEITAVTESQGNYQLDQTKIVNARLVLYVDRVRALGQLPEGARPRGYIRIYDYDSVSPACFPPADATFNCGAASTLLSSRQARNANKPDEDLEITDPGFYSFDVTEQVKHRLNTDNEIVLTVAYATLGGDVSAEITLASSEKNGQPTVLHQPQLLITLKDTAGISANAKPSTSVLESSPDKDYAGESNLWLSGATGDRANALIQPPVGFNNGKALFKIGLNGKPAMFKQSVVTFVNSPVAAPASGAAKLDLYDRDGFADAQLTNPVTWNTIGDQPLTHMDSVTLKPGAPNQVVVADSTAGGVRVLKESFRAAVPASVTSSIVVKTNAPSRFGMDSADNFLSGQAPRLVTVVTPLDGGGHQRMKFDQNNLAEISYCVTSDEGPEMLGCNKEIARRARLNQTFLDFALAPLGKNSYYSGGVFASPINLSAPLTGPSAILAVSDHDTSEIDVNRPTYRISGIKANNIVGKYQLIVSMPGHNARGYVDLENLELPTPKLSGPTALQLPTGNTSIIVPTDAAEPFRLNVADPVKENIDETTHWRFTSSNPADTMPGDLYQTDGKVPVAFQFSGAGRRTLTVTSLGDSTLTATMDVTVSGDVAPDLIGQTITFAHDTPTQGTVGATATVSATGGASGNPVVLAVQAGSTQVCTLVGTPPGTTVHFDAAGTCTLTANQAGDATYAAAPEATWSMAVTETGPPVRLGQAIVFLSTPPVNPVVGGTYVVRTQGGASNNPVTLSIVGGAAAPLAAAPDAARGAPEAVCTLSGDTVTFTAPGTCTIEANQAGNAQYAPALAQRQSLLVAAPAPIPALGQWALALMGMLMAALVAPALRARSA